ncbi:MAG: nicotinate phosphoribosyltransferase, partial [Coriobacteriales bacterium]|nr:nicotinate phosphoribosyltransferase [Coriobacteriales bacterium]
IVVDEVVREGSTKMVDVLDPLTTYDLTGRDYAEMLVPLVKDGHRVGEPESILTAKGRCRDAVMHLDPAVRRFLNPQAYPVGLEPGLADLRQDLARAELG